jgi:carbonic anhydrase
VSEVLLEGLRRFRDERVPAERELYTRLAQGQSPHTLFVGCSDSRVVPTDLTGLGPGDLFVVRNVANIIPPWDPQPRFAGTSAAVEFAVSVLGVRDIVVCGHSGCSGVAGMYGPLPDGVPHLAPWLSLARAGAVDPEEATALSEQELAVRRVQRNVALSVERLAGFPMVAERVDARRLRLHGWYYDIGSGRVDILDLSTGTFQPLD